MNFPNVANDDVDDFDTHLRTTLLSASADDIMVAVTEACQYLEDLIDAAPSATWGQDVDTSTHASNATALICRSTRELVKRRG